MFSYTSISSDKLSRLIGTASAPTLIDVRIEALRGHTALAGALSAITAAVVGVILNLSIWFALHTLFRHTVPIQGLGFSFDAPVLASVDLPALALSVAAATAIFRFNVGMPVVLAASCITGVLLRAAGVI
jgi:chromate transporter